MAVALASAQESKDKPQTPPAPPPQTTLNQTSPAKQTTPPKSGDKAPIKPEELEQMLAPIALYPDALLSQIFMASTYPLEIVQADRWVKANKSLKGDALATALEKQTWDPSVKSLVNCPDILAMMSEKIDWTAKLGDAFLAQQKEVMDTVQKLRAKAQAEGNLKDSKEQKIVIEQGDTQVIKIESTNPQVIYVPTYNPTVVYGSWPYPSYPPYPYYPPGYAVGGAMLSFGLGVAWGYAWGSCNWGGSDVDIDINRNTNINTKIDRSKYQNQINQRKGNLQGGKGTWQHDPSHRQGVSYRDQGTAQKFGQGSQSPSAKSRDAYRGRADAGRQELNRGGAGTGQRPSAGTRDVGGSRSSASTRDLGGTSSNRAGTSSRGSAFDGMDRGGQNTRAMSSRGQSSLSSAGRSGAARGGRGGGRGGGGGRR
jgi:hypothetical protein